MRFFLFLGLVFIWGCSSVKKSSQDSYMSKAQENSSRDSSHSSTSKGDAPLTGSDLSDNESDIEALPQDMNGRVSLWIEYFQGRGRERMQTYLERSSRYLPKMKEILKSHGLPEDLVYIALIESGFSSKATSRARAVGFWQFVRATGRHYGLKQNYYVDERRDFVFSTEAAAKYLKALYNLFGSWYLAIASYNVGENRVKRLVMKHYTRNFWDLAQRGRLPKETINYVPKFLAARLIAKHPERYGFDDVVYRPPLSYSEFSTGGRSLSLRKLADRVQVSYSILEDLNPSYKRGVVPNGGKGIIRVPKFVKKETLMSGLKGSLVDVRKVAGSSLRTHRVRPGDTLSHIAQRYGTSIRSIREVNNLRRSSILYAGKKLKIPLGGYYPKKYSKKMKRKAGEQIYRVRRGDNLYNIARRFGVTIGSLKKRNRLGRGSLLVVGKVLIVPLKGASRVRGRGSSSVARGRVRHHVVQPGETLIKIARRYGVSLKKLTRTNRMSRRSLLAVGKRLKIPF